MNSIKTLGGHHVTGAYLLWMEVQENISVSFGRFQNGQPIEVKNGNVIYIGSAMGKKGSMTLARRLLRHASRSDPANPQKIRADLLTRIDEVGLGQPGLKPPAEKKLYWNIDHLLDKHSVHLSGILLIRSPANIESQLAEYLMAQPETYPLAPGLGAHDFPGHTHILTTTADRNWWLQLPQQMVHDRPFILEE